MKKDLLIQLIETTHNEAIIDYLYAFSKDFIYRYSAQQRDEPCVGENQLDRQ